MLEDNENDKKRSIDQNETLPSSEQNHCLRLRKNEQRLEGSVKISSRLHINLIDKSTIK